MTSDTIDDNIRTAEKKGSAVTCTRFFETPIISSDGESVEESPDRSSFYTAQAPQTFNLGEVLRLMRL